MDFRQLMRIVDRPSSEWGKQDVVNWLKFIKLDKYIPQFEKKSIDGSCLKLLDQKDLVEQLGIKSRIICKKILNWTRNGLQQFDNYLLRLSSNQSEIKNQYIDPFLKTQVLLYDSNDSYELKKSIKKKQQWEVLILKKLEGKQNVYYKFKERDCRIGVDQNCQVALAAQNVDQFHVLICFRVGGYYLRNISDNFSTFIKVNSRMLIFHGMKVQMGSNVFQFIFDASKKLQIKIIEGKNSNMSYKFLSSQQKLTIGRKASTDISLPLDSTLSNLHARISYSDQNWYLEDLATTNGTWIELDREIKVNDGLVFKLGLTNFQFQCQIKLVRDVENQQQTVVSQVRKSQLCSICQNNCKNILFYPCSHCVVCQYCARSLTKCIICFQKINQTTKIFKS